MGADFVKALDAEIDDLKRGLAADIRYMRLQELENVRRLYVGTEPQSSQKNYYQYAKVVTDAITHAAETEIARRARRVSPERQRILHGVWELLVGKSEPIPTSFIYEHLQSEGIEVGGADPKNNLSAMLSNSDRFQSHGRSGWTIVSQYKPTMTEILANSEPEHEYEYDPNQDRIE